MTTFVIENFGCRATEADTTALRHKLLASGLTQGTADSSADIVILNTCTVTAAADMQAREAVRKIYRENPSARVIVTGCYAQRAPEELAAIEGVSWVVGNSHQSEIPRLIQGERGSAATEFTFASNRDFVPLDRLDYQDISLAHGPAKILTGDIFERTDVQLAPAALLTGDRTRPVLKIQDGCSNRCSYCVIPFVRGRSRSLDPQQVVREVQSLVAAGAKEVVLSGINLGSYGSDLQPRESLLNLARRILEETAIQRLRFSSIEPQDVTEDLVSLVAASSRIARYFHVPLQSGCDRILRAMHRWYRTGHYAERIERVRAMLPDAAIGADVIVGFPGETDEEFQTTVDFIGRTPLTYLHVFSFSVRPGTAAANSGSGVPPAKIRERARTLRSVSQQKSSEFRDKLAGTVLRALSLARSGEGWTEAISGNYLKVRIRGSHPANEWMEVCLPSDPLETVKPLQACSVTIV